MHAGSQYDTAVNGSDSFGPARLTIHTGDSVVFHGSIHTLTFAGAATVAHLRATLMVPMPQKVGAPLKNNNRAQVWSTRRILWGIPI